MRLIVLSLFILLVASQTAYTTFRASFVATAPQWGSGYFTGTLDYDWTQCAFKISFDNADNYTELYIFNTDCGYNTKSLTGQFTYQYLYKTSKSCPCETNGLQYGMPAFFVDANPLAATSKVTNLPFWIRPTPANYDLKRTDPTTKYFANFDFYIPINGVNQPYYLANTFWVDDKQVPAGMTINDIQQRTFTFTSVNSVASSALSLKPPTSGCKCAKLLDLAISLDRSGSIDVNQWKLEKQFTTNLTDSFDYGPDKANVGIVNWNAKQWTTLPITSGDSYNTVKTAVSSMGCCGSPPATSGSCCCCGTPIGGGLWAAGDLLLKSSRTKATKVICILTDGCQNHIWDPLATTQATSCGCPSEKICETNTNCTGDITKWYNWVTKNIPGVKIISIGVGAADAICPSQLLLAAGNDPTMVFNPQSWSDLLSIVQTISATACTTDAVLCPDCCGICSCGQCFTPSNCFDQDKCNKGAIPPGGKCCGLEPITCNPPPCNSALCDPQIGCVNVPLKCKPPTTCTEYFCDNSTKGCSNRPIVPVPTACLNATVVPECVVDLDCDDGTNCTSNACKSGKCFYTPLVCPADTMCNITACKPTIGCYTRDTSSNCNDNDVCTIDFCDPVTGCSHKNVTCPQPTDPCFYAFCLSAENVGCTTASAPCNLTAENCTVPACNQTCYLKFICPTIYPDGEENAPPTTIILASTLTTAAVVGIVVGAVILAVGVGGGAAVAVAGGAGMGGVTAVYSNPTYAGSAMSGNNPLSQDG